MRGPLTHFPREVSSYGHHLIVAVTDDDWFEMLRRQPGLSEVNFWAPSAATSVRSSLARCSVKLHAPRNVIVGWRHFRLREFRFRVHSPGTHSGKQTAPTRRGKMRAANLKVSGAQIPGTAATFLLAVGF